METISDRDLKIIKNLGKPSLLTKENVLFGLAVAILVTLLLWMFMLIGNSDWTLLKARVAKYTLRVQAVSQAIDEVFRKSSAYEIPPSDGLIHYSGDIDEEFRESAIPDEVQRVMQNPEENLPVQEPYLRTALEDMNVPFYTQEELPLAKTWAVNKSEITWVWEQPLNYSHTEIDFDGEPFMVAYAEWEIGVRGAMGSFKLLRSDRPGHSKVSWVNEYGMTEIRELPFEGFIQIRSDKNPDTYLYQTSDGWIHFVKPAINAHPIWTIQFEFGGALMQQVSAETIAPMPFGLIKMDDGLWNLYRGWTDPLRCPDENYLGESCNSLR